MTNLIEISPENGFDVILDLRYNSANNVTGQNFYAELDFFTNQKNGVKCYLHPDAAAKLKNAINLAAEIGLKLKIFDAFRPLQGQEILFNKFPGGDFVSNPKTGAIPHCRGIAIDLTLVNAANYEELEMGTEFDNFTAKAFHANTEISLEAQKNRFILLGIMSAASWDFYSKEWWHYQLFKPREFEIIKEMDHGCYTKIHL